MKKSAFFISVLLFTFPVGAKAQTLVPVSDINFGSYDFSTSYNVQLQLGTDGNAAVIGAGVVLNGGENAGQIRITQPDTGIVEVKCSATALLTDPTATSLTIENIEVAVNSGVAFGNGNACNGTGAGDAIATTIDMDANPDPDVYIGGEIVISSPITLPTDHTYSSTGTGTPVTMSIVIQ